MSQQQKELASLLSNVFVGKQTYYIKKKKSVSVDMDCAGHDRRAAEPLHEFQQQKVCRTTADRICLIFGLR